jgi:hypothetical protein
MYCDRCGKTLNPGAQFCESCGKPVAQQPPAAPATAPVSGTAVQPQVLPRVQRHLNLLATLWMANAVLRGARVGSFLLAGRILPFFSGWGFERGFGNWPFDFLGYGLYILAIINLVFGLAHALFAISLWQRQPWARVLGLVIGFISLIRIPFGTAMGIYTLWVLLPDSSRQEYEQMCLAYQLRSHVSA